MFKLGDKLWVVENSATGEVYLDTLRSTKESSIDALTQYQDHYESIGAQLYLDAHEELDGYHRDQMKKWVSEQDFLICHQVSMIKSIT